MSFVVAVLLPSRGGLGDLTVKDLARSVDRREQEVALVGADLVSVLRTEKIISVYIIKTVLWVLEESN